MSDVTSLVLTEADTFKYLLISILTFFMYLWLCWVFAAALGLSLVAVCRLLIAMASPVPRPGL